MSDSRLLALQVSCPPLLNTLQAGRQSWGHQKSSPFYTAQTGSKAVTERDSGVAIDHPSSVLEHHQEVTLKVQMECEMGKYQDLRQYGPHFRIPVNLLEKENGPENSHDGFSIKSPIMLSPS